MLHALIWYVGAALAGPAWALTRVDAAFAGRAFATYGGVYIAASLAWPWAGESSRPYRWELVGATLCVIGSAVILLGPRTSA